MSVRDLDAEARDADDRRDLEYGPDPEDGESGEDLEEFEYEPDDYDVMERTIHGVASLAGTFDVIEAGIAIDHAEAAGLEVGSARAAVAALLAIRSALMDSGDWPPGNDGLPFGTPLWEPRARDKARVKVLFKAARLVDAHPTWSPTHRDEMASAVRWVARLVGGIPADAANGKGPSEGHSGA